MNQGNFSRCGFIGRRLGTFLFLILCLFIIFSAFAIAEERHEDHEALRALLKQAVAALDSGDIEKLRNFTIPDVLVTTAEQHRTSNFDDFKKYYDALFNGPSAQLTSISFQPVADELTKFISDNLGIVSGTSTDTYKFKDGDVRQMTSRWTSTVIRDSGQWKIASFHFGVNFLDNPVLDAVKSFMIKVSVGCAIAGLIIGFLLARMIVGRANR